MFDVTRIVRPKQGPQSSFKVCLAALGPPYDPSDTQYWAMPSKQSCPSDDGEFVASSSFEPFSRALSPRSAHWRLPPRHPRTFFFLDRFTDASRVITASNNVIANAQRVRRMIYVK